MSWNPFKWSIFRPYPTEEPEKIEAAITADFRAVFQTAQGARVLAEIMKEASLFQSTISKDRVDRDMIDGKRELALTIAERAGFMGDDLPDALLTDNLKTARKEKHHERDWKPDYEPAPEPVFEFPIGDE